MKKGKKRRKGKKKKEKRGGGGNQCYIVETFQWKFRANFYYFFMGSGKGFKTLRIFTHLHK